MAGSSSQMISGVLFWLSPGRRRFMRKLAKPALAPVKSRLAAAASPPARAFVTTILQANAEFLAFALSPAGMLADSIATPDSVAACISSMLIYSANLFAREELASDRNGLIELLSRVLEVDATSIMLARDALRKAPRGEEWMLYEWLRRDLGMEKTKYDAEVERNFGFQYLSYIGQYRPILERAAASAFARSEARRTVPVT